MEDDKGLTWPQIRYWAIAISLGIGGLVALIVAQFLPWQGARFVVGEIGVACLIAGILAGLVEPFFREEFARDAFLAAFRYVLPRELKNEVERILKFNFISDKHVWNIKIEKVDDDTVCITISYERRIKNITSSDQKCRGFYQVFEWGF